MQLNSGKMKFLLKKASLNFMLDAVQMSFGPNKITSNMKSPKGNFAVSINTNSNDVLMNGGETVKFNLLMNGHGRSRLTRSKTETYYNRVFKSHSNETDERNAEITDTSDPEVRKFNFDGYKKNGNDKPAKHSLTLVNDDHDSIRDITIISDSKEIPKPFFICDINKETLKTLTAFPKKMIHSGKYSFTVKDNLMNFEQVLFNKDGKISTESLIPLSKFENNLGHEFGIEFNYRNFLHVLDVLTDKDYELQILFINPEQTRACILIRSKDGEETYYLTDCEIVPAEYERRFKVENDEDFLPNIETEPEIPQNWNYTESVEKTKGLLTGWKNLSKEMLKEIMTAKRVLKKTPSERAQIMHGTYVGWMTWTQYCKDIGHSTQVVNRWLKRAFGESESENSPEIKETNGKRKLPNDYVNTIKNVIGSKFGEKVSSKSKQIFLDLQHQTKKERKENIDKLVDSINDKKVDQAMVLTNSNGTYSEYFKPLYNGVMCFTDHRIPFEGNGNNTQGSCFVYFGENEKKFVEEFSQYGVVMKKGGVRKNHVIGSIINS